MYEKQFFNPHTQYDPEYRNVQAELWQLLTDDQQAIVAGVFCHLKNHAQVEVAEALIDYLSMGVYPDPRDWTDSFIGGIFSYINQRINPLTL